MVRRDKPDCERGSSGLTGLQGRLCCDAMRLIKKYGNRRLYDTTDSAYVTMAEVAARIRGGDDVRVVDAKSGNDLTAETLTQIIFEDRNAARLLPVPLLLQLIRMGEEPLAEFLGRYVTWALETYLQARQGMGGYLFPPFASAASTGGGPFGGLFGGAPRPASPPQPPAASQSEEVAELRRAVEELKKDLRKGRK
jgi:polyhydroxyalkanoate synthesis repressor PhaR